jgi:lipopolysaccharide export LptBFGC system permease protein LptF
MKKAIINSFLLAGIFLATITLVSNGALASPSTLEDLEKEQYQLAESIMNQLDRETIRNMTDENNLFKVYNTKDQLVFETRNSNDQKLKILIGKSDLLTTINNITYYKLSR